MYNTTMKTDETIDTQIRKERLDAGKKVLNWLGVLPWAILSLVLTFIVIKKNDPVGSAKQVIPSQALVGNTATNQVSRANPLSEFKELQLSAIKYGYAKWAVDEIGGVTFEWIEGKNSTTNIIRHITTNVLFTIDASDWQQNMIKFGSYLQSMKEISSEMRLNKPQSRTVITPENSTATLVLRDEPRFGKKEMTFAKSIKFDVEGEITKNVCDKIGYIIHTWDGVSKADLLNSLKDVVANEVKIVFDGFEAYNK